MWCDVKNCSHNENGYCGNKDYISIDSSGQCDSINIPSVKEETKKGAALLTKTYYVGQRLLWRTDEFDSVSPDDIMAVVTEVTETQVSAKTVCNGNNSDGLTLIIGAWNESDFTEDTSPLTRSEKAQVAEVLALVGAGTVKVVEDPKFRALKDTLFSWGPAYIEEFIGYVDDVAGLSRSEVEVLMNRAFNEMSGEKQNEFYSKFSIN